MAWHYWLLFAVSLGEVEAMMTLTIDAIFDGKTFQPTKPVALKPNTHVKLTILAEDVRTPLSFLDVALSLNLDGPPDWSLNLDKYLYGEVEENGS